VGLPHVARSTRSGRGPSRRGAASTYQCLAGRRRSRTRLRRTRRRRLVLGGALVCLALHLHRRGVHGAGVRRAVVERGRARHGLHHGERGAGARLRSVRWRCAVNVEDRTIRRAWGRTSDSRSRCAAPAATAAWLGREARRGRCRNNILWGNAGYLDADSKLATGPLGTSLRFRLPAGSTVTSAPRCSNDRPRSDRPPPRRSDHSAPRGAGRASPRGT